MQQKNLLVSQVTTCPWRLEKKPDAAYMRFRAKPQEYGSKRCCGHFVFFPLLQAAHILSLATHTLISQNSYRAVAQ